MPPDPPSKERLRRLLVRIINWSHPPVKNPGYGPDSDGENSYASLKKGDKVKVTFGSRWYDAEVAETCNPKSKKGEHYFVGEEVSCSKFV